MSDKVTYIEELFDLDNLNSDKSYAPQSLDGYPHHHVNQNFDKQMDSELFERNKVSKPLQTKIRKFQDPRVGINGGQTTYMGNKNTENETSFYHTNPINHNQRIQYTPQSFNPLSRQQNDDYLLIEPKNKGDIKSNNYNDKIKHHHKIHDNHLLIEPHNYNENSYEHGDHIQYGNHSYGDYGGYDYKNHEKSCLEIANHVKHCPICSKLYDNDKSIYIIVIVILAICTIILLKKVIETK